MIISFFFQIILRYPLILLSLSLCVINHPFYVQCFHRKIINSQIDSVISLISNSGIVARKLSPNLYARSEHSNSYNLGKVNGNSQENERPLSNQYNRADETNGEKRRKNYSVQKLSNLSQQGKRWDQIPKEDRRRLLDDIVANEKQYLQGNSRVAHYFVYNLMKMNYRFSPQHETKEDQVEWMKLQELIHATLISVCNHRDKQGIVDDDVMKHVAVTIYSLGKMEIPFYSLFLDARQSIYNVLIDLLLSGKMSERDVVNIVYGLGKMQVIHQTLSKRLQSAIEEGILNTIDDMNNQDIANTFYGLGCMGANFADFHEKVKLSLNQGLINAIPKMKPQEFSNSLYGLSKMQVKYQELNSNVQAAIEQGIVQKLDHMNKQEVANTVYSLGCMTADFTKFDDAVKSSLYKGIVNTINEMNSQEVAITVYGLGGMRATYDELDQNVVDALLKRIYDKLTSKNVLNEHITQVIFGLGKMGAEFEYLNPSIKSSLLSAFAAKMKSMNEQEIANCIYGLGLMQAEYKQLPSSFRKALMEAFYSRIKSMKSQEISNILYGLSSMEYNLQDFDARKVLEISKRIQVIGKEFNLQEICNMLYSMVQITISNGKILKGEDEEDSTIDNLVTLLELFDDLFSLLSLKVAKALMTVFAEDELRQLFTVVLTIQFFPKGVSFLTKHKEVVSLILAQAKSFKHDFVKNASSEQIMIVRHIHKLLEGREEVMTKNSKEKRKQPQLRFVVQEEYYGLACGLMPIDIAIIAVNEALNPPEHTIVCFVEVDGPHHYTSRGELRKRYQVKDYLYKQFVPTKVGILHIPLQTYTAEGKRTRHKYGQLLEDVSKLVNEGIDVFEKEGKEKPVRVFRK